MRRERMVPEAGRGRRLVTNLIDRVVFPKRFQIGRAADDRLRKYIVEEYDGVLVNEVRLGDRDGSFSRTSGWRVARGHLRVTTVTSVKSRGKETREVTTRRVRLPAFLISRLSRKR